MLKKVKVKLKPIIDNINLPTVLRTKILPGENSETIFIATGIGEILYIRNDQAKTFLDIRDLVIKLEGNEERGLIGFDFHPNFNYNGLFYLHYSKAGSQGTGAILEVNDPNPCNDKTLNLTWTNRETNYDHIDTVEEWILESNGQFKKHRTILNLRRPFSTHNGFNSLNFSPETEKLVLTLGDGGHGYDPFNLSQNNLEIFGKIIEIDINKNVNVDNTAVVSRFDELPDNIQDTLTVIAKGIRNVSGITFQKFNNGYIKYIGNVGQRLVESIFAFVDYIPIPVREIVQNNATPDNFINFGWRAWEGIFPTASDEKCSGTDIKKKNITYYDEAIKLANKHIYPLTCSFHEEVREDKFKATAITGVRPYMGNQITELTGNIIFSDLLNKNNKGPARGALAYIHPSLNNQLEEYSIIEIDYDFGSKNAFFVGLGSNIDGSKLYLLTTSSTAVTDFNQSTIFEIVS